MRARLIRAVTAVVPVVTFPIAALSSRQSFRSAIYIAGGLAGVACLSLMLLQPLLVSGYLPGLKGASQRLWHRWFGAALIGCVALHVGGLYLTSPPDALDALLLVSPTPFSVYGVVAMWGMVLTGLLVLLRKRFGYGAWRVIHNLLGAVIVGSTVVHALMIEGTMGGRSKLALCLCLLLVSAVVLIDMRILRPLRRNRAQKSRLKTGG